MTDAPTPRDVALAGALEALVMACELPGDHCEVAQALPAARAALASSAGAFSVYAVEMGWQPIETKPDRPMPVLYLHTRLKWADIHGNPATFGAVRDAAERTTVGFWSGRNWCESGTGHDVFEDWHDIDDLPTHWRPIPAMIAEGERK